MSSGSGDYTRSFRMKAGVTSAILLIFPISLPSVNRAEVFQFLRYRIVELDQSRGRILLQVFDLRSSGNWKHDRRFPKQPCERDLRRLRLEALCCARQRAVVFREFASGEWKPRDEADVFPSAIFQHVLGISIDQIISILHRNDRCDATDRLDLLYVDLRQSNMADLALTLKIDQRADLIFHRYFRVDPVQL